MCFLWWKWKFQLGKYNFERMACYIELKKTDKRQLKDFKTDGITLQRWCVWLFLGDKILIPGSCWKVFVHA